MDSLQQLVLKTKEADSSKCSAYVELIKHYKKNNEDSCKVYFQRLYEYAKQTPSHRAYYNYYRLKAAYFSLFVQEGERTSDVINDNLLQALKHAKK
ncbi:MAG: hypothetical protein KDD08_02335, partial [Mangrovimonas sp.]|nr:hypothetical protein [Mangrovimonas sp.]